MIDTIIVKRGKNDIDSSWLIEAAKLLKNNEVVAFPTETVYGLGGNALSDQAVSKIYKAKGRPSDNPLIVHIADEKDLEPLVSEIPNVARLLMDAFWPGPLTLIFKKSDLVGAKVTGGLNTVAIRMPSHKIARDLIRLAGVPVAAPSANISGKPSPTSYKHVIDDLSGRVSAIVCGEISQFGLESTVLDISGENPMILRPGGVTFEMLSAVVNNVSYDPAIADINNFEKIIARSPGMKYTHYAPKAPVFVINGGNESFALKLKEVIEKSEFSKEDIGILCSDEVSIDFREYLVKSVGKYDDLDMVASNLFDALRYFDQTNVKVIYAQGFPLKGIGIAIMNRLNKASGGNIIGVK